MAYCPKCGAKVEEEMVFCPSCGAPLKMEKPAEALPVQAPQKAEKTEKHEKEEKGQKAEKHEKREVGFLGPLIAGLILICIGLFSYLQIIGVFEWKIAAAFLLILIGIIIIIVGVYAYATAARRHPKP